MSRSFKAFNIIQIIFLAILVAGSLAMVVYCVSSAFNLSFLDGYRAFIYENCAFLTVGIAGLSSLEISFLLIDFAYYIQLAIMVLIFVSLLVLLIRITNPERYYQKFRVVSFIFNLIIMLLMAYNIYLLITEVGFIEIQAIIACIVSLLFVLFFVYHLIMNIVGKKQVGEDGYKNVDPNTFFGSNNGAPKMGNYGASAGGYVPPAPSRQAPPPPPVRRAPPPPPPKR